MNSSHFFFNDTATTEIYTLALRDALPICQSNGKTSASRITRNAASVYPATDHKKIAYFNRCLGLCQGILQKIGVGVAFRLSMFVMSTYVFVIIRFEDT